MKKSFLTFIVALFSSTVSLANNSDFKSTQKLADQGHAIAQYNLGWMYDEGEGVPQDNIAAVKWYSKAAKQGHAKAQYNLAQMYYRGRLVPQDDMKAYAWASIVTAQENLIKEKYIKENSKKYKKKIRKKLTTNQLAEGQKLVNYYWEKYVVPFNKRLNND